MLPSSSSNHILRFASFLHSASFKPLTFGRTCLQQSWHWSSLSCDTLFVSLLTIIYALPFHFEQAQHLFDCFNHPSSFDWNLLPQHFHDPLYIFVMALCNGLPWVTVLAWFSSLSAGWFTPNSFCFASAEFRTVTSQTKLQRINLVHPDITGHLTLFLFADSIVFIAAPFTLRVQHDQWVDTRPLVHSISRPGYDFHSRFWPDYVRMPSDDNGQIIYA